MSNKGCNREAHGGGGQQAGAVSPESATGIPWCPRSARRWRAAGWCSPSPASSTGNPRRVRRSGSPLRYGTPRRRCARLVHVGLRGRRTGGGAALAPEGHGTTYYVRLLVYYVIQVGARRGAQQRRGRRTGGGAASAPEGHGITSYVM
eukprot:371296-Prorocentrum_minimum.AAC.1